MPDRRILLAVCLALLMIGGAWLTLRHPGLAREAEASALPQWERLQPWTLWAVPAEQTPAGGGILPLGRYRTLKECETARQAKETAQRRYIASIKPLRGQGAVPTQVYICSVQDDDAT